MRRPLALLLALASAPALAGVGYIANAAVGASLIAKTIPAELYDVNAVAGASAGFVMVFDAKTVPADGAVTPAICQPLAANAGLDINLRATPMQFVNGIVVVFSTTGCFSKTASATAYLSASVL